MPAKPFLFAVLPLFLLASPVSAESLATSASSAGLSASSAGSASLRGSSDSIRASSGERENPEKVSEGEYRVAAVAEVEGRPEMVRLTMAPASGDFDPARGFTLDLPRRALGEAPAMPGDLIQASRRPYGLEFARGAQREAFFLVLAEEWERDLQARKLGE